MIAHKTDPLVWIFGRWNRSMRDGRFQQRTNMNFDTLNRDGTICLWTSSTLRSATPPTLSSNRAGCLLNNDFNSCPWKRTDGQFVLLLFFEIKVHFWNFWKCVWEESVGFYVPRSSRFFILKNEWHQMINDRVRNACPGWAFRILVSRARQKLKWYCTISSNLLQTCLSICLIIFAPKGLFVFAILTDMPPKTDVCASKSVNFCQFLSWFVPIWSKMIKSVTSWYKNILSFHAKSIIEGFWIVTSLYVW